ncbi:MAG: FHA domain-containing protein [Bdellovibrionales bacterium]
MWVLRILTGPQAGKTIPLKEGTNIIGRAPHCTAKILSSSISKEHAKIDLLNGKIILSDMNSRNGTFVDGVKISSQKIEVKQKFALHDIIMDIVKKQAPAQQFVPPKHSHYPQQNNAALNYQPAIHHQLEQPDFINSPQMLNRHHNEVGPDQVVKVKLNVEGVGHFFKNYIDRVVLPGVYALAERIEFKTLMALFVGSFIVFVTLFSSIPLMRILTDSIEQESMERAQTIAKTLAEINKQSVASGNTSALTIQFARNEIGVKEAYIVDAIDKLSVLAPASKAGQYANVAFALKIITRGLSDGVKKVDDDTVVAVVGIPVYNPSTGSNQNQAYSIVVYNMGQLAVSGSKTISLLVQTLFIALIVGSILFFFMYRVIVHPIRDINKQLDKALNNNTANVSSAYDFPDLQSLISNINSSLSRISSGGSHDRNVPIAIDRSREMENLVLLIGFPAIGIRLPDLVIEAINPAFEEKTNHAAGDLLHGGLDNIMDQALRLSIQDLLEKVQSVPDEIAVNQLEISGDAYEVSAQSVFGLDSIAYVIISLLPPLEGGE